MADLPQSCPTATNQILTNLQSAATAAAAAAAQTNFAATNNIRPKSHKIQFKCKKFMPKVRHAKSLELAITEL